MLPSQLQLLACLTLSFLVVCANLLVISLFRRSPRLLSAPSNLLLLFLAAADLAPGVVLVPVSIATAAVGNESFLMLTCRLPYAAMMACEVCSMLFVVAIALDKVVSLARPLTYGELVTKRSLYAFAGFAVSASGACGSLALVFSGGGDDDDGVSPSCIDAFRPPAAFATYQAIVFLALVAPCAAVVSVCAAYVYAVASRHARDIRKVQTTVRNKEVGETSRRVSQTPNNLAPPVGGREGGSVAVPSPASGSNYKLPSFSFQAATPVHSAAPSSFAPYSNNHLHNHDGSSPPGRPLSRQSTTRRRRARLSYAYTLGLTTLSFFLCRLPRSIFFLASDLLPIRGLDTEAEDALTRLSCLPYLIGCALDPWLYAYHNLDLKPLMRRQVRRLVASLTYGKCDVGGGADGAGRRCRDDPSRLNYQHSSKCAGGSHGSFMLLQTSPQLKRDRPGSEKSPSGIRRRSSDMLLQQNRPQLATTKLVGSGDNAAAAVGEKIPLSPNSTKQNFRRRATMRLNSYSSRRRRIIGKPKIVIEGCSSPGQQQQQQCRITANNNNNDSSSDGDGGVKSAGGDVGGMMTLKVVAVSPPPPPPPRPLHASHSAPLPNGAVPVIVVCSGDDGEMVEGEPV